MAKKLSVTIKNAGLGHLLSKPLFLTEKDEKELKRILKKKDYKSFYDYGSKIIKSSSDVRNLYIYIKSKLEEEGLFDELIDEKSKLILKEIKLGNLFLKNPVLEKYLGNKVSKKEIDFFEKYKKYIKTEETIQTQINFIESEILDYYNFIKKAFDKKEISELQYNYAYDCLSTNLIITKQNGHILGSLISEELQQKLGFLKIFPKIKLEKSNN